MNNLDRWAQFNYFWDVISPELSVPERQVWLAIFRHADTFGVASVTRSRIGDMLGITPKGVSDGIKGLSERKLIEKIPHGYGYKLCVTSNENVTPSNENVTGNSNENVTPSNENVTGNSNENVTPPSRKRYTPPHENVTQYRTYIQNRYTEYIYRRERVPTSKKRNYRRLERHGKKNETTNCDTDKKAHDPLECTHERSYLHRKLEKCIAKDTCF